VWIEPQSFLETTRWKSTYVITVRWTGFKSPFVLETKVFSGFDERVNVKDTPVEKVISEEGIMKRTMDTGLLPTRERAGGRRLRISTTVQPRVSGSGGGRV
jgi:hypothetical protein